ncbi:hypothetical protein Q1695_007774 [Nippostrongylus brasiliensis]|nr:hypothetical protein Q1695_007774 [Nippostrongylus brasiliensis]
MCRNCFPIAYQVFYVVVPTICIIGNSLIVYVTIRTKRLRSPSHICIALLSGAEILQMLGEYVTVIADNVGKDHYIPSNICVYLQSGPIFGMTFASTLLTTIAFDRLMSLQSFYNRLVEEYRVYYIIFKTLPAITFATALQIIIFNNNASKEPVFCVITSGMTGPSFEYFHHFGVAFTILTLLFYVIFLVLFKKLQIGDAVTRTVQRSLMINSMTVISGRLCTYFVVLCAPLVNVDIYDVGVSLLAGVFIDTTCAVNFFVYYFTSSEYRNAIRRCLSTSFIMKRCCSKDYTVDVRSSTVFAVRTTREATVHQSSSACK